VQKHQAEKDQKKSSGDISSSHEEDLLRQRRKARATRRAIYLSITVFFLLLAALIGVIWAGVIASNQIAGQQTQDQANQSDAASLDTDDDTSDEKQRVTAAPDLYSLLGESENHAIDQLGHGATVTRRESIHDGGNVMERITVTLTSEPGDENAGTPVVYLGLDRDGYVIRAGYSASILALGYGRISFIDAAENEHVIEKTLREAGVPVKDGSVSLPEDSDQYSSYASDGSTLTKEEYTFSGTVTIDSVSHGWSAVLSYDYSLANESGNLSDTIRRVFVYIDA
jgi:hypothetical protein